MDKIICVGKNYLAHAIDMGEAMPEQPVLFLKPASVIKQATKWHDTLTVDFPVDSGEEAQVQPECELVLLLQHGGYRLSREQAVNAIAAVSVGLDMTLRARQRQLKRQGHPWTTAKVFPDAAIIAPWLAVKHYPDYLQQSFSLSINGELKQQATGSQMVMAPIDVIVYASQFFPLCPGDVVFTGTPAGVTNITEQDELTLTLANHALRVRFRA